MYRLRSAMSIIPGVFVNAKRSVSLHTVRKTAQRILDGGADYLMAVKSNARETFKFLTGNWSAMGTMPRNLPRPPDPAAQSHQFIEPELAPEGQCGQRSPYRLSGLAHHREEDGYVHPIILAKTAYGLCQSMHRWGILAGSKNVSKENVKPQRNERIPVPFSAAY